MSDSAYNTARLWTIVGLCLLRLAVTRHHLQAYLGLAERWVEQMRREAGRIAAVEIQRKVQALGGGTQGWGARLGAPLADPHRPSVRRSRGFTATSRWSACSTWGPSSSPCTAPCSSKRWVRSRRHPRQPPEVLEVGFSWGRRSSGSCPLCHTGHHSWGLYPEPSPVPPAVSAAPPRPGSEDGEDVRAAVEQITGVLGGIFTPLFFRGLLAFVTWWVAVCQVVTSLFGLYFHQYLAAS